MMPISDYMRNLRDKIGHEMLMIVDVAGVVVNEAGEVLLERRSDDGRWCLPGGALDPGEDLAEGVVREVWEETGVQVVPERISGVYSGPDFLVRYPNGDEAMIVSIVFACRPVAGEPHVHDEESLEVRYFAPDALPPLEARHQLRIRQALRNDPRAHFRWNGAQHNEEKKMNRQVVATEHAPKAIGPYSQAIIANGFVYCSGQGPIDPATGKLVEGDIAAQTTQVLKNLSALLQAAGTSLENVVKTTVFLHNIADFQAMNKVYSTFFTSNPPARSAVGGNDLPLGILVEIEAVAVLL
jgi:reactive intermediate/imine deaminase